MNIQRLIDPLVNREPVAGGGRQNQRQQLFAAAFSRAASAEGALKTLKLLFLEAEEAATSQSRLQAAALGLGDVAPRQQSFRPLITALHL